MGSEMCIRDRFDMDKLASVSRDVISKMSEETLFDEISVWAKDNDKKLNAYITASPDKFRESIKLWKYNGKKVRKDIAKWSDLSEMFPYLYGDGVDSYEFDEKLTADERKEFLSAYISAYDHKVDSSAWFDGVKAEFKKIIWPEQKSVVRQTIAVIVTSVVVGLIIALLDWAIQHGVNFLVGLKF